MDSIINFSTYLFCLLVYMVFTIINPFIGIFTSEDNNYVKSEAEILINQVTLNIKRIMWKKYSASIFEKVTIISNEIHEVEISLHGLKKISVKELRVILLECTQTALNEIKINEKLQPYLAEGQTTLSLVQIILYNNGHDLNSPEPEVTAAKISKGILSYYTSKKGVPIKPYKELHSETYEEALEALRVGEAVKDVAA